jgi:hypothetical protein
LSTDTTFKRAPQELSLERKEFKGEKAKFSAHEDIQIPDKPCSDPTASTTTTPRFANLSSHLTGEWVWGYI